MKLIVVVAALFALLTQSGADDKRREQSRFLINDEWMSLPEAPSVLDFHIDTTPAADDDIEGQMKIRDSRFWGRIHIDGWPQTIQFFRAHFGVSPPIGKKIFVFAEPRNACEELTNAEHLTSDHIILAWRGECTYGTKAKFASKTKAGGIVVINNEMGIEHLPGPDAHDLQYSVISIAQLEGQLLETVYDEGPIDAVTGFGRELSGYIVPINCAKTGAFCVPATVQERLAIANITEGGTLKLTKDDGSDAGLKPSELPLEYIIGHFGVTTLHPGQPHKIVLSKPVEACSAIENDVKGKIVLVRRGSCPFVQKAEEVQRAGGLAMIAGGTHNHLIRMGVLPRWKGLNMAIPVVSVTKRAYGILVGESYTGGSVTFVNDVGTDPAFNFNKTINGNTWEMLENLWNGEGWPRSEAYTKKKYEELREAHKDWPDRVLSLDDAYKRKLEKEKEEGGSGSDEL